MSKAYWISVYRSIKNPDAVAAYTKLAAPALQSMGARYLARGMPEAVHEAGLAMRAVVIEFDSVAQAEAAYRSPAYQEALKALGDGAERDIRIVAGV